MTTIKSYTDLSQSKKLAEILPIESADMYYDDIVDSVTGELFIPNDGSTIKVGKGLDSTIAAWSLTALLGVLPEELEDNHFLTLSKEKAEYCCCYEDINGNSFRHTFADNPIDACYEMILKLNELNLL